MMKDIQDQIKAIPDLQNLIKKVRSDPKYSKYTNEELEQMLVPWFILNYAVRMDKLRFNTPLYGEGPWEAPSDIKEPHTHYFLTADDKKRIADELEKLRKLALKRKNMIDTGGEPPGGYDRDLAMQRKYIIKSKGLKVFNPDSFKDRVLFWWKKVNNDNGAFVDWASGVVYRKNGEPMPGNVFKALLNLIIKNITEEKNDDVKRAIAYLRDVRNLWDYENYNPKSEE